MNPESTTNELFERYLQNSLDDWERKDFEDKLKIDPDFSEAFRLYKEVDSALLEEDLLIFRQTLDQIHSETQDAEAEEAPMLLTREENKELDKAIEEHDVLSLRAALEEIHADFSVDEGLKEVPKYAPIERAVANQDASALHEGLEQFGIDPDFAPPTEMAESDRLSHEIDQAIAQSDVIEFRSSLNKVSAELLPERSRSIKLEKRTIVRAVSAAALILLFVSSGLILSNQNNLDRWVDRNLDNIASEEIGPGAARGGEEQDDRMIQMAYEKFSAGEYNDASRLYVFVEDLGKDGPHTWIYQGRSLYEEANYSSALPYFQRILDDNDNSFLEEADWFMVKCLIRLERKNEANAKLLAILNTEENHDYKKAAKTLYDKIN